MTLNESSSNLLVCYKRHKNRVLKSFDVFIKFLAMIDLNTLDIRTVEMYPVVIYRAKLFLGFTYAPLGGQKYGY